MKRKPTAYTYFRSSRGSVTGPDYNAPSRTQSESRSLPQATSDLSAKGEEHEAA